LKLLPWIVFALAVFIANIGVSLWVCSNTSAQATHEPPKSLAGEFHEDASGIAELCRRGLMLLEEDQVASGDSPESREKGGAMVQTAWVQQARHPTVAPKIWGMTESHASRLPQEQRDLVLALFLQSVDDAIELCEQPGDFDVLWKVRMQVVSSIAEGEEVRTKGLSSGLADVVKELAERGVKQCLLSGEQSGKVRETRLRLESLHEASDELPKEIGKQLQEINVRLTEWIQSELERIESRYAKERERDATMDSSVAAVSNAAKEHQSKGSYTQLLDEVEDLWRTSTSPEATFWMQYAGVAGVRGNGSVAAGGEGQTALSLEDRFQRLRIDISRSIRIRYNIWAVGEISQAGKLLGPQGCVALGRIDNGLLDPSVSALYSTAQSQVFQSIDDPNQRHVHVRKMLSTEPVGLDAF
jgi:hypothetical protein